jgi:hypothetical protein
VTLIDSETTRDYISLLPLRLTMNDLFRREKFAPLPRVISKAAKRTRMFAVRQLAYWPPGPDLAIFYRQDNETIPDPGIIILGKIRSGIEVFSVRGSIRVTLELAEQPPSAS